MVRVIRKNKMSKGKGSKQNRLSRFIRAPVRILSKARDFYIQSLTSCAGNIRYAGFNDTMALPAAPTSTLPKSFSVSSSRSFASYDEDFQELLRVASLRTLEDKFGTAESPQHQVRLSPSMATMPKGMGMGTGKMPRSVSHSVAIARIDENEPCDFAEYTNNNLNATNFAYPRSRSCATVTKRPVLAHF